MENINNEELKIKIGKNPNKPLSQEKKEPKVYLRNKDFLEQILISIEQDRLTPKAEEMIILLANKSIKHQRFQYYKNPDDKKDVLQTAILIMLQNWKTFDVNRGSNVFSYMTEVFKRAAAKGYNDLHKLKGDQEGRIKIISMNSANDGEGLFSI